MQTFPRLTLKKGKEKPILQGHHWIYSGAIKESPSMGLFAEVFSIDGKKLGISFLSSGHSISAHMISFGEVSLQDALEDRIQSACKMRASLFNKEVTSAYRLINAEGDGLPGLIVDVYDDVIVLQIAHPAVDSIKQLIVDSLVRNLKPTSIYEKSTSFLRKKEGLQEAKSLLYGEDKPIVVVKENGLYFEVDLLNSQKTGLFLDQREMRSLVKHYAKDKKVLNGFAYTGGFSIAALSGGAKTVDSVEISAKCEPSIQKNLELNGLSNHQFIKEDCFKFLERSDLDYDIVILDPPAFVKNKRDIATAFRAYKELNRIAISKMKPGTFLLTASCSYHVGEELFQNILFRAALEAGKKVKILGRHRQAPDHPVSLYHPESGYLKSLFLMIEGNT